MIPVSTADRDQKLGPGQAYLCKCIGNRRVTVILLVRDHARQHGRDRDIQHRAEDERRDDTDRHIALGVLRLLGLGGYGIEADIAKKIVAAPASIPRVDRCVPGPRSG